MGRPGQMALRQRGASNFGTVRPYGKEVERYVVISDF
jgi:hypothetical protein